MQILSNNFIFSSLLHNIVFTVYCQFRQLSNILKFIMRRFFLGLILLLIYFFFIVSHIFAQNINLKDQDKKNPQSLKVAGRIQSRIMLGEKETQFARHKNYDAIDFNFRRIRLTLQYQKIHWYGGIIDIKAENLLTEGFNVKSALQEANIWFEPGFADTRIKLGQFKLPFLREQITSSSRLLIPERAFSANTLQQFDIGILLTTYPLYFLKEVSKKKLVINFSITNGDGSGQDGEGLKSVEANTIGESILPLYNWRMQYNLLGGINKEGKEIFEDETRFSIGAGGAYSSTNEGNSLVHGKKFIGHTIDMTLYTIGIYINNEYTLLHGEAVPKQYHTFQITVGYNIPILKIFFMPILRYNYLQEDSNQNEIINLSEQFHDIWVGFNFFVDKNNLKLQVFYQIRLDHASEIETNKKNNLIYFQIQMNFNNTII